MARIGCVHEFGGGSESHYERGLLSLRISEEKEGLLAGLRLPLLHYREEGGLSRDMFGELVPNKDDRIRMSALDFVKVGLITGQCGALLNGCTKIAQSQDPLRRADSRDMTLASMFGIAVSVASGNRQTAAQVFDDLQRAGHTPSPCIRALWKLVSLALSNRGIQIAYALVNILAFHLDLEPVLLEDVVRSASHKEEEELGTDCANIINSSVAKLFPRGDANAGLWSRFLVAVSSGAQKVFCEENVGRYPILGELLRTVRLQLTPGLSAGGVPLETTGYGAVLPLFSLEVFSVRSQGILGRHVSLDEWVWRALVEPFTPFLAPVWKKPSITILVGRSLLGNSKDWDCLDMQLKRDLVLERGGYRFGGSLFKVDNVLPIVIEDYADRLQGFTLGKDAIAVVFGNPKECAHAKKVIPNAVVSNGGSKNPEEFIAEALCAAAKGSNSTRLKMHFTYVQTDEGLIYRESSGKLIAQIENTIKKKPEIVSETKIYSLHHLPEDGDTRYELEVKYSFGLVVQSKVSSGPRNVTIAISAPTASAIMETLVDVISNLGS